MGGIALCIREGNECIHKDRCKRYIDKPNELSSFCDFPQICNESTKYQWWWTVEQSVVQAE